MFLPAIAGIVGLWAGSRGKPNSRVNKRQALGPRTGITYEVDDLPETGVIVVRAHGSAGVFKRKAPPQTGFEWVDGKGNRQVLAYMIEDFLGTGNGDG